MKINAIQAQNFVRHCELLSKLSGDPFYNFFAGFKIYQKLRRMENKAHYVAEQYCNGAITDEQFSTVEFSLIAKLHKILPCAPKGMFINGDPRGYALKIHNDEQVRAQNIYRDMGGFGILAPKF